LLGLKNHKNSVEPLAYKLARHISINRGPHKRMFTFAPGFGGLPALTKFLKLNKPPNPASEDKLRVDRPLRADLATYFLYRAVRSALKPLHTSEHFFQKSPASLLGLFLLLKFPS
jgi:hypothetical protein